MGGGRSITWTGHVKMMAAAQPFLSGAISKTINMPEESTVEDIMDAYIESWKLGLKAVAIYRDNSKRSQPLSAAGQKKDEKKVEVTVAPGAAVPVQQELFGRRQREKMPTERASVTHKFSVGGHEGYLTVGMYEDGRPGEIFIKMSKEGSTLSGVMDGLALTDLARIAVRRAAEGFRRQTGEHAIRTVGHHARTPTSASSRRCWTTSRAGSAGASSPPTT